MTYYVDFEGTLFNTDAYEAYVRETYAGREPDFAPGELSKFLYPDGAAFLRDKENAATIITRSSAESAEKKIRNAVFGIPRVSIMFTNGVSKGEYLAPHTHLHANAVLVDDNPSELETLAVLCSNIKLFEARRDGAPGDGRWPVIHSLSDLPSEF